MTTTDPAAAPGTAPALNGGAPVPRSAWWVRLISRLPFGVLYALADFAGWLALRVLRYRDQVVRENLTRAFPDFDEARLRAVMRDYYLGFAQMFVEILKSATMTPAQVLARVEIRDLQLPLAHLERGQPVLLVAAHQCNWEWMLLALTLKLGFPLDAAYKPLVDSWAEREMKKLRTRFGSRLVPAKDLLADIIKRRGLARAIAMVADQEPTTSETRHWTRFLNRDTAFYLGPEEITRVTRFPVFFIRMRRLARGRYEMGFLPLAQGGETLPAGDLTERYARLVEEQIRAAPPDWPWSHKRWKLKKSVYQSRARSS